MCEHYSWEKELQCPPTKTKLIIELGFFVFHHKITYDSRVGV